MPVTHASASSSAPAEERASVQPELMSKAPQVAVFLDAPRPLANLLPKVWRLV